jgi:hypothetical protein
MKAGTEAGATPAKVLENVRPTEIAGLAKLVELVKKYAAPMLGPDGGGRGGQAARSSQREDHQKQSEGGARQPSGSRLANRRAAR